MTAGYLAVLKPQIRKKGMLLAMCVAFSTLFVNAQKYEADTSLILMGKSFKLKAVASNDEQAHASILVGVQEIQRIEALISSYQKTSETYEINKNAGVKPVKVSIELFNLIERCKKVSALTKGAFDISFTPLYKVWKFNAAQNTFPPKDTVSYYDGLVNWQNIQLDRSNQTVFLVQKGMRISFGSIGKGYAANKAKIRMQQAGAKSGFVNASGDILFWGKPIHKESWSVGIKHPKQKTEYLGWLQVKDMAVVTSGDYEKYMYIDGKRLSHIVDPRTGYPIQDASSVTIICPDAELADALATSVSVLGAEEGIQLINRLKNVECLFINHNGKVFQSKNLILNQTEK